MYVSKNATHTPGPWKVDTGNDGDGIRVYQQRCRPELHGAQPLIAALDPGRDWIAVPDTELGYNARLIAAAPDLLAALEQCLTGDGANCLAYGTDTPSMRRRFAEINRIATEAIRKAKGE